jgi:O-antigen/teichoic acid export membrane protein
VFSDFKQAAKNTIIYSFGNIATKLIGVILIPIYTNPKYLSLDDYGVLGDIEILTQLLIAILGIALYQSLTRWYWDKKLQVKQKTITFTITICILVFSIFVYIPFHIFTNQISILLLNSSEYSYLIRLMFYSAFLQTIGLIPITLLKLQYKSTFYSLANILKLIITLLFTIYFVVYEKRTVEGIFEAQIIGGIFILIILSRFYIKNIEFGIDFTQLKEMIRYSYPLVLASISGILLSTFDRFGLTVMKGLERAGVYSLGFKISNVIKIVVITSIQLAISPMIFKKMNDPDAKSFYKNSMSYIGYIVIFFSFLVSIFSFEFIKTFTNNNAYYDAVFIIPILSYSLVFSALKDMAITGLNITKKTNIIGVLITVVAIINLILNYFLIPIWDIFGASVSTLFTQF